MFEAYKRYADFRGRAGRSEYWMFVLLFVIVTLAFSVLTYASGSPDSPLALLLGLLYVVFVLGSFVPSLAVAFRRLHDTDRSAWWLLLSLIPLLGDIVLIVFNCLPGAPGENRFGPPTGAKHLQETFA
jgi:uncharacterized membrane protein YhaH (DUF805 family)